MSYSDEIIRPDNVPFRKYCRKRLSVQKEFIKLFYGVLSTASREGKEITNRQTFELLNKLHFNMTGKNRFENYELFLITLIRLELKECRHPGKDNVTTFN